MYIYTLKVKITILLTDTESIYFYNDNNHALCRFGEQAARLKICPPSGAW